MKEIIVRLAPWGRKYILHAVDYDSETVVVERLYPDPGEARGARTEMHLRQVTSAVVE